MLRRGHVQFARSKDGGYSQFAIKFFLRPEDYAVEQRLYQDPQISRTLPDLVYASDNADQSVRSKSGMPFPPFMVMERGASLSECVHVIWCMLLRIWHFTCEA